jgi:RNA polymerase sigma-70 factor (ECF subfamily)
VWQRFVYIYEPLLNRWAGRLGLQDADRCDLVQEVLLALLRALPTFEHDGKHSFRSWLRTVALNKWRDFQKKRVPVPMADDDGRWNGLAERDPATEFAEDEYRSFVAAQALQLIKAEFQPATWQAFWATVVYGRPAEEVARALAITSNAVYLARGRVLRRLRVELEGLFE